MQASVTPLAAKARSAPREVGLQSFSGLGAVVIDAGELVKCLTGAAHVDVRGFAKADRVSTPNWTHPSVVHVGPADSPQHALSSLLHVHRRRRGLLLLGCALACVVAFCAGAIAVGWQLAHKLQAPATIAWSPVQVLDDGLMLATPAGRVVVPPGGKLPNGDVVVSVHAARRTVVLSSGTMLLAAPERRKAP